MTRASGFDVDYDVVTIGESLGVFGTQEAGRLTSGRAFVFRIAGAESNLAIALQRLGLKTQWISALGQDEVGHAIQRELCAEGVSLRVHMDTEHPTATMVKVHRSAQAMTAMYFRSTSAYALAQQEDFAVEDAARTRCLHFSGISIGVSPGATAAIDQAIDIAKRNGALVSMDVNHRFTIWKDQAVAGSRLREFAARCDIVFASQEEAALLVGEGTPEQQAGALNDLGSEIAVIKLGAQGAMGRCAGRVEYRSALDVSVVDAVGAGDAFAGGFLASYLRGADFGRALANGNTVAAFAVTAPGDWENLPGPEELDLVSRTDMVR